MTLTMFDSINVGNIPAGAAAVAGYVNGRWPTYNELVAKFPKAHVLGIAVTSWADAECLDVEPGDATPAVAGAWVKRQEARGVKRPVVYTSVSQAKALIDALAVLGIRRGDVRLWTAHYTGTPHLCSSACGFGFTGTADATQWTDKAYGRSLDASLVADGFFGVPAPKPAGSSEAAPTGEPKNSAPFTRALWPVPLPAWFWAWAWWRQNQPADAQARAAWLEARPSSAPKFIPPWAWVRLAQLGRGAKS